MLYGPYDGEPDSGDPRILLLSLLAKGAKVEMAQVRYFLAVCQERNFTRAAKRSGVSQPSLTTAIKRLEEEFGGLLFERGRPFSGLTKLGVLVEQDLQKIERSAAAAKRKAEKLLAGRSGSSRSIGNNSAPHPRFRFGDVV